MSSSERELDEHWRSVTTAIPGARDASLGPRYAARHRKAATWQVRAMAARLAAIARRGDHR